MCDLLELSAQGVPCPQGLTASGDMGEVVAASEVILMVIPTPFVAATVAPLAQLLRPDQILVSCTKGILNDTLETPNEVCSPSQPVRNPGQAQACEKWCLLTLSPAQRTDSARRPSCANAFDEP